MKILVIWRRLTVGGVLSGWRNRALYFAKHGIKTEFLLFEDKGGGHILRDTAKYVVTDNKRKIIHLLQTNHYDCIIVVDFDRVYPLLRKAGYTGPIITESRVPIKKFVKKQVRYFYGVRPSRIVVPSQYQRSLVSAGLRKKIPIRVIHNAIDSKVFQPVDQRQYLRNKRPVLPSSKKIIAWVGRIHRNKNWDLLLKVARKMVSKRKDIHFWVIGRAHDKHEERKFNRRLNTLRLKEHVHWFNDISYQEMPQIYTKVAQSGGCLFSTTKHESFGNIFIEAMACKCPVVAPRHTAIPEVVPHKKAGLLYRPLHTKDAVRQLRRMLDYKKERQQLINKAFQRVQKKFTFDASLPQYVRLLKKLR